MCLFCYPIDLFMASGYCVLEIYSILFYSPNFLCLPLVLNQNFLKFWFDYLLETWKFVLNTVVLCNSLPHKFSCSRLFLAWNSIAQCKTSIFYKLVLLFLLFINHIIWKSLWTVLVTGVILIEIFNMNVGAVNTWSKSYSIWVIVQPDWDFHL